MAAMFIRSLKGHACNLSYIFPFNQIAFKSQLVSHLGALIAFAFLTSAPVWELRCVDFEGKCGHTPSQILSSSDQDTKG